MVKTLVGTPDPDEPDEESVGLWLELHASSDATEQELILFYRDLCRQQAKTIDQLLDYISAKRDNSL